jgi:hypothetical protein
MSLEVNIKNSLTRIASEFKTVKTIISGNSSGSLSSLTTTQKTNLVAAINELKGMIDAVAGGGAGDLLSANNLSDVANAAIALANLGGLNQTQVDARVQQIVGAAPGALDTLAEIATALGNDANFASTVTTALANRVRFDSPQTLTAGQITQVLTNIGAAPTSHTHHTMYPRYDAAQTLTAGQRTQVLANIGGAPVAHDHHGVYVRYDSAQTLSAPQRTQVLANIGAAPASHDHNTLYYTKAEIGDVASNLVTHFESGLV